MPSTLPANKIRKIATGGTTYDIVPTMLQDGTTNFKLSVPTLTADSTIALAEEAGTSIEIVDLTSLSS